MLIIRLRDCATIVGNVLSLCPTDSRTTNYINRATERLLYSGAWKGCLARYQVCVSEGCITWPRQLETIEAISVCSRPLTPRTMFFEFLGAGPGVNVGSCCGPQICSGGNLIDKGEFPAFTDITKTGQKLAIYSETTEASDASLTIQYFDKNNNFVTSVVGGQTIDGERITLPASGAYSYSANEVMPGGFVRAYRNAPSKGRTRIYSYDVATTALIPLAVCERDELVPVYRRSLVPGLSATAKSVDVIGKLRFVPVSDMDDFMVISYPEAIRLGAQAVLKEENSKLQEAAEFWSMAIAILEQQLKHFLGDGSVAPIALTRNQLPAVANLI